MNRRRILQALVAGLALPATARAAGDKEAGIAAARRRMRARAKELDLSFPFRKPRITIHKKDRRLELFDGKILVKGYDAALGLAPVGHKQKEGDNRTPEGTYFICYRNFASAFHLFLGFNYPNAVDAEAALARNAIDRKTAARLTRANEAKERPWWGSPLGGAVGLHGGGTGSDWTWGCIALTNDDMDELWTSCPIGTPLEILP